MARGAKKSAAQKAKDLADKIAKQILRGAGKGINAGRIFLAARIKETLSVPAPRKKIWDKHGNFEWVATTAATPGAPPRKVSGKLRSSVWSIMLSETEAMVGANARSKPKTRWPQGFPYPIYHEVKDPSHPKSGQHTFVIPTFSKWKAALEIIIGAEVNIVLKA